MRRVVAADGRSRAYLNGQSVTVQQLREAGNILLDIHGQHEFQTLTRSTGQRDLLDTYGRHEAVVGEVEIAQRVWLKLLNAALELETKARDRDARLSLLRYQAQELTALGLTAGEFAGLTEEATRMANRGRITESVQGALGQPVRGGCRQRPRRGVACAAAAEVASRRWIRASPPSCRWSTAPPSRSVKPPGRCSTTWIPRILMPPARIRCNGAWPPSRSWRARTASHRRSCTSAPRSWRRNWRSWRSRKATWPRCAPISPWRWNAIASRPGCCRRGAPRPAGPWPRPSPTHMQLLGMTGGRFQIDVTPLESPEPQPHGVDQIEFRVTANPGQPLRALSKVASGGELARLSLAVQVACAGRDSRCMVFDEVDSGIGGAIAEIVGRELRTLAERAQVLCVTHLPQVASQGNHHLRVNKLTDGKTTRTSLSDLSAEERVEELARMLGGVDITAKAREHAQEMLRQVETRTSGDARSSGGRSGRK